ncbi:HK97 gp10 family phage protein [Phocea massiliensis]|uniref:HK97 gp10 family phage protein n=1 Tax=Merdimmobilis hominis TaxID=2897707 RepID=UPI001E359353|nr:HK97 gp10 family phage protein [Merdimmobilis hominis]MCD4835671.1 HK97 gp10 family phage protein [Merdimmobilis hominis]
MQVKIDNLSKAVMDILEGYSTEVAEEVKEACRQVAQQAKKDIVLKSPKRTGEYAKGWKVKKEFEDIDNVRFRVYNPKHYQLTHLLEYGHTIKNGTGRTFGETKARPHIRPAEQMAKQELPRKVKEAIELGAQRN